MWLGVRIDASEVVERGEAGEVGTGESHEDKEPSLHSDGKEAGEARCVPLHFYGCICAFTSN